MNNTGHKEDNTTVKKYIALMSTISSIEGRLRYSDLSYLFINVLILLFTFIFTSYLLRSNAYTLIFIDLAFIFSCTIIGMAINIYWICNEVTATP